MPAPGTTRMEGPGGGLFGSWRPLGRWEAEFIWGAGGGLGAPFPTTPPSGGEGGSFSHDFHGISHDVTTGTVTVCQSLSVCHSEGGGEVSKGEGGGGGGGSFSGCRLF